MTYKINNTTVIDDSRNVCACCVCSCCVSATTQMIAPSGATGSRPGSPATGSLYFDTTEGGLVAYNGSAWVSTGATPVNNNSIETGSRHGWCFMGAGQLCAKENPCAIIYPHPNGGQAVFSFSGIGSVSPFWFSGSASGCAHIHVKTINKNGTSYRVGLKPCNASYTEEQFYVNYRYLPYCGINDTNAEATTMIVPACVCTAQLITGFTPYFQREGYWVSRDTCVVTCCPSFCTTAPASRFLFTTTGCFRDSACNVWASYGDACCGVFIRQMALHCCASVNCSVNWVWSATFGFKPCYFYSTATSCPDTTSPIRYFYYQSNTGTNNVSTRALHTKIDWHNKRVWFVNSTFDIGVQAGGQCLRVSVFCICDRGFPDCQSCWCIHTSSISSYTVCSPHIGINACLNIPTVSFFNNNRCELVLTNCSNTISFLPLCGNQCAYHRRIVYCISSTVSCCLSLVGAIEDNDGYTHVYLSGTIDVPNCNVFRSKIAELIWAPCCNITCTTPYRARDWGFCDSTWFTGASCVSGVAGHCRIVACHAPPSFSYDPITCRISMAGLSLWQSSQCCWSPFGVAWVAPMIPVTCDVSCSYTTNESHISSQLCVRCLNPTSFCLIPNAPTSAGGAGWQSLGCGATTAFSASLSSVQTGGVGLCNTYYCAYASNLMTNIIVNNFTLPYVDVGDPSCTFRICPTLPWF